MPHQCLIAEYNSMADARVALDVLETDHFTPQNVSVISHKTQHSAQELAKLEARKSSAPNAGSSAGVGAAMGGSVTAPLAAATLIGPFIVAGPIAGMATGAVLGGLLHSTERWGVQRSVAEDYERRLNDGSVLVIVNDEDPIRIDDAETLLKTCDHESMARFIAPDRDE